jgi:hypothetical protein
LPPGAYVCEILGVKYTERPEGDGDLLQIQFDIAEGDKKGFFKQKYDADNSEDKKFKGKTTLYPPNKNTTDEWKMNKFTQWVNAIEDSNKGYIWDWDEKKWKGKLVGIVFGKTGSVINGTSITYTEARFPIKADDVRNGNAPEAKFKAKNGYGETPEDVPMDIQEDLPF